MANAVFAEVFPDALKPLKEADPEVWGLVQKEKERQWCGFTAARGRAVARVSASVLAARAAVLRASQHAPACRPNSLSVVSGRLPACRVARSRGV